MLAMKEARKQASKTQGCKQVKCKDASEKAPKEIAQMLETKQS